MRWSGLGGIRRSCVACVACCGIYGRRSEEDQEAPGHRDRGAERNDPPNPRQGRGQKKRRKQRMPARRHRAERKQSRAPHSRAGRPEKLEGIGPKISSVLQAAGITTYAQLADTDVDATKADPGRRGSPAAEAGRSRPPGPTRPPWPPRRVGCAQGATTRTQGRTQS